MSTPRILVGYVYGAAGLDPEFAHCLDRVKAYDETFGSGFLRGAWKCGNGGTSIPTQRNRVVAQFLETDADWLWFIDTDQTFDPDILERLMASADPVERPVVSALVMAYRPEREVPVEPACTVMDDRGRLVSPRNIPAANPWEVAAVGAGCLFVHRSVYERMAEQYAESGFKWFANQTWRIEKPDGTVTFDAMGEDYVFSLRAGALGVPILVDTDIVCGHRKTYEFLPADFWRQLPYELIQERTYVVIPVKDHRDLTESLLNQLARQGGYHGVIVLDNGSGKDTRRYLARQTVAEVIATPELGIHEMWNLGATVALKRWPKCNLAFLNNDLNLGPDFLTGLATELRSAPELVAVSPNYDGRAINELEPCNEICANRYDGTGGAPGFAFMAKGELFQSGYRFPEDCRWWYGDNDLLLTIRATGGTWALSPTVTVEHVNGGGQTGDWESYVKSPQHELDRKAFVARWSA